MAEDSPAYIDYLPVNEWFARLSDKSRQEIITAVEASTWQPIETAPRDVGVVEFTIEDDDKDRHVIQAVVNINGVWVDHSDDNYPIEGRPIAWRPLSGGPKPFTGSFDEKSK